MKPESLPQSTEPVLTGPPVGSREWIDNLSDGSAKAAEYANTHVDRHGPTRSPDGPVIPTAYNTSAPEHLAGTSQPVETARHSVEEAYAKTDTMRKPVWNGKTWA